VPRNLQGQAVSAVDTAAIGGVSVQIGSHRPVTTDAEGNFSVDVGSPDSYRATLRGTDIVERQTTVYGPTAERTRVSLIPASFDLAAFDEMFRTANERLQRWTSRPSLVVLGSVMIYRTNATTEFEATGEQLSDAEITEMVQHLTEGLGLLTGNTFTSFASVEVERPSAGARVTVMREGRIVVGRYTDVASLARTIGYGTWSELPNGTVTGGAMFLDRGFDKNDERRRLLRIHELGHALGYLHVRTRVSIMNPSIGPEPTDFDRAAAVIAFQRQPGNRSPDVDPATSTGPAFATIGGGTWQPPVLCGPGR
ncbi:MAG TPA: hypothetical protein VG106_10420, partial [Vicinamibacterales bacterium]|nr:hypothetical protein [Vicinamibacterales bacterium]